MTMLQAGTAYFWSAVWLSLVGIGSGMFNSPNTAAMMGAVPVHRRGVAAGAPRDVAEHRAPLSRLRS